MAEITATEAARRFADLLDAVEHRGERFTITRRGRVIACIEPSGGGRGADVKALLRSRLPDAEWRDDLDEVRALTRLDDRS